MNRNARSTDIQGSASDEYVAHDAVVHIAASPLLEAEIGDVLVPLRLDLRPVSIGRLIGPEGERPVLGAGKIIVELTPDLANGDVKTLHDRLAAVSRANPVLAILDPASVDVFAPLLDVPSLELLVWPGGREALMQALQQLHLSERAAEQLRREGQVDIEGLRTEVERIARTLSALVEHPEPQTDVDGRSAAESGRMLREIIRKRRARANFFPAELFADPAWDILLDLAAARHEGVPVSVSSLCIASAVPTTTALRWIKALTEARLLQREADPEDGRRSFISLTDESAELMERYLDVAG